VLELGRGGDVADGSDDDDAVERKPRNVKQTLIEHAGSTADVPADAYVTPEQVESALGRVRATEQDAHVFEGLGEEEEMALMGRLANPPGIDYDCVACSPVTDSEMANAWLASTLSFTIIGGGCFCMCGAARA
jgi:hypothetical protein